MKIPRKWEYLHSKGKLTTRSGCSVTSLVYTYGMPSFLYAQVSYLPVGYRHNYSIGEHSKYIITKLEHVHFATVQNLRKTEDLIDLLSDESKRKLAIPRWVVRFPRKPYHAMVSM